jgi:hypothetical protein
MFGRPAGAAREIVPGSATSHARPSRRAEDLLAPPRRDWERPGTLGDAPADTHRDTDADTPTDPYGFPPIPADSVPARGLLGWPDAGSPAVAAAWSVAGDAFPTTAARPDQTPTPLPARNPGPTPTTAEDAPVPHPAEAAALAAAFAADYLSWDEDDPDRRAGVLGDYLADRRPVRLGWSGHGRQRADFALPGLVRPDGEGRVLVDVRVRVTPYRRVPGGRPGPADDPDEGPAVPAAAPAPAARGWRGLPGRWVRLGVAVRVEGDRLVVDAEEELDGAEESTAAAHEATAPDAALDTALDDDAPLEVP